MFTPVLYEWFTHSRWRPADGGRRVPAQAGIDHQLGVGTDALAGRLHLGQVALLALAEGTPAELDGAEAAPHQLAADPLRFRRRVGEEDRGVGPEAFAE